jgi:hypothetical protein
MTPLVIAAALSLLALDAAPAVNAGGPAGPAATPAKPPEAAKTAAYYNDAVICTYYAVTGSHFKKRVCKTRAVIDEENRRNLLFENRLGEMVGYKPLDSNSPIPAN